MQIRELFQIALSLVASSGFSTLQAHHSFAATFTNDVISVEGRVTELKFSNPHVMVYLDVIDEQGNAINWAAEGQAATLYRSAGWDANTLVAGDYIRISGNSSRNGSPMISVSQLNLVDPQSGAILGTPGQGTQAAYAAETKTSTPMTQANGSPNLSGTWTMGQGGRPPSAQGPGGERPAPPAGGDASRPPRNAGGPPPSQGGDRPAPPEQAVTVALTEAGTAFQAQYDPIDDPQVQCEPPGLIRQAAFTPHPVSIKQYEDRVVISYEEYGGVRSIAFGDSGATTNGPTSLGTSAVRYEGEKLIIETSGLLPNLATPFGYALSEQTTTIETYYRNSDEDGKSSLQMDMVVTDPVYLAEPWTISWTKYYAEEYDFIAVDCRAPLAN